jgi:hypothetical protein
MAKDGESTEAADTTKKVKGTRKSANITATPMRVEVTPNRKQGRERKQEAPKKSLIITLVKARGSPRCQQKGTRLPR